MSKEPVLQVLVPSLRYSFLGYAGVVQNARAVNIKIRIPVK
jgi:hypothetical protein